MRTHISNLCNIFCFFCFVSSYFLSIFVCLPQNGGMQAKTSGDKHNTATQFRFWFSFFFFGAVHQTIHPTNAQPKKEKKISPTFSVQTNIFTEHKLHNTRTHNTQRCRRIDRLVFSCRNKSILSSSRIQWLHCCQLHGPSMFMFGSRAVSVYNAFAFSIIPPCICVVCMQYKPSEATVSVVPNDN